MPNAEGRAATRGRAKKDDTTPATGPAAPAAGETELEKKERIVRSPLERAEAAVEKAKHALDKAKAKLAEFEKTKAALAQDVEDAQVEFDYANMHPVLVKKRKEAGAAAGETSLPDDDHSTAAVNATVDADEAESEGVAFGDGSEIKSSVPVNPEDIDPEDAPVLTAALADSQGADVPAPSFDFATALASNQDPFSAAAGEGNVTRV